MNNIKRYFLSGPLISRRFLKALNQKPDPDFKKQDGSQEDESKSGKSDIKWTDIGMFWTTIALTIGTLLLFWDATHQTEASKTAAEAATRAETLTERAFERDSIKNIQTSYTDSVKFQKQFDLAAKSLQEQITAITETQKQFELENKPYIQISDIKIDTLAPNKKVQISYYITNYGKQPAIIKGFKYKLDISFMRDFQDEKGISKNDDIDDIIIPPNNHADGTVVSARTLEYNEYLGVVNSVKYIFLMGEVIYLNSITQKERVYIFDVSPYGYPKFGTRSVVNKDVEYRGK